jgi:hypothetical protein
MLTYSCTCGSDGSSGRGNFTPGRVVARTCNTNQYSAAAFSCVQAINCLASSSFKFWLFHSCDKGPRYPSDWRRVWYVTVLNCAESWKLLLTSTVLIRRSSSELDAVTRNKYRWPRAGFITRNLSYSYISLLGMTASPFSVSSTSTAPPHDIT